MSAIPLFGPDFLSTLSLYCSIYIDTMEKTTGRRLEEVMTTGLPDFFKYNLWANLRLLDACEHLSDAQLDATTNGTFGSLETLMHLLSAEEGYARSLTGTSPTPLLKEFTTFPGLDLLRKRAERSADALMKSRGTRNERDPPSWMGEHTMLRPLSW